VKNKEDIAHFVKKVYDTFGMNTGGLSGFTPQASGFSHSVPEL